MRLPVPPVLEDGGNSEEIWLAWFLGVALPVRQN
jgi:hypothetical protein